MRGNGLPEVLPAGYHLIFTKKGFIAVKEGYEEVFAGLALSEIMGPETGALHSGRGKLKPIQLSAKSTDERALLRRYFRGGLLGRFSKEFFLHIGRPRPLKELQISEYARAAGIETPEVLAAVIEKTFGLFYRGALVTREIYPATDLQEEILKLEPEDDAESMQKKRCIDSLGRLIAQMHKAGIYHADLHLKNILKSDEKLYLLDLDAARLQNPLPEYRKRMNLFRLYRSVEKVNRRKHVVNRTDALRFIHTYAEEMNLPESAFLKGLMKMLPMWRLKWRLSDLLNL